VETLAHVAACWNAAAAAWSPDALASLYADDAVLFGGRARHFTGRDGVRAYFESYRGMLAAVELTLKDQVAIQVSPELVLAQGFADIQFTLGDGRRTSALFRTTWLLQASNGLDCQIKAHHFSPVPEVLPIPT
jgi:uncharacterized protein (TIGR02246 family)